MCIKTSFPTCFAAWRNAIEHSLNPIFQHMRNVSVADRLTALHAWFDSSAQPKLFGMIRVDGSSVHSHEHRLLFAVPHFDRAALEDWWSYAKTVQQRLVQPDALHQFTFISIILICDTADSSALSRLRWRKSEVTYHKPQNGWSSIRFAVIHAASNQITSNRVGTPLADLLRTAKP